MKFRQRTAEVISEEAKTIANSEVKCKKKLKRTIKLLKV